MKDIDFDSLFDDLVSHKEEAMTHERELEEERVRAEEREAEKAKREKAAKDKEQITERSRRDPGEKKESNRGETERQQSFGFSEQPTLEGIRQRLEEFARERDWNQFHTPRNLCLALVGEVGELAELFQWRHDAECTEGLPLWTPNERSHLADELADVLLYLLRYDIFSIKERILNQNASPAPIDSLINAVLI
jgi:NTP pyrophosphatase (non-canonical NTP hydrolase)